jgi:hypothetical protein
MQGLLAAFMNPPLDDEAGFNAWYDEEHVPLRRATPGFLTAARFKAAGDADYPRYLALYDLTSVAVLESEPYLRLARERSPRETAMLARIPMMDRRVLELRVDCPAWTADPPWVMTVAMSPPPNDAARADFVAWYAEEHVRVLLEIPGWRRVRLFEQLDGQGPGFLAVHELERPDVFDDPGYPRAIGTPWRARIRSSVSRYERNLFRRL